MLQCYTPGYTQECLAAVCFALMNVVAVKPIFKVDLQEPSNIFLLNVIKIKDEFYFHTYKKHTV